MPVSAPATRFVARERAVARPTKTTRERSRSSAKPARMARLRLATLVDSCHSRRAPNTSLTTYRNPSRPRPSVPRPRSSRSRNVRSRLLEHPYFHPYNWVVRHRLSGRDGNRVQVRATEDDLTDERRGPTRSSKARVRSSAWSSLAPSPACTFRKRVPCASCMVSFEAHAMPEPVCEPLLVDVTSCDGNHRCLGVVDVRRIRIPRPVVERSMNITSAAHAARLLPSGNGWFQARRHVRTAALSTTSG